MGKTEFLYRAKDVSGRIRSGRIAAANDAIAKQMLVAQGLEPIEVTLAAPSPDAAGNRPSESRTGFSLRWRRNSDAPLPDAVVLEYARELAGLVQAAVPLDRAFRLLHGLFAGSPLEPLIGTVAQGLRRGQSLSQAMASFEPQLGSLFLAMIRAGEATGNLAAALTEIVQYLERRIATRKALVSALTYPAILLVVSLLSLALILGFVVPQFRALFDDLGDALPLLTQWVVQVGDAVRGQGHWLIAALVLLAAGFQGWRSSARGRRQWDRWLLHAPLIGVIVRQRILARYLRTLGTLLKQGVALLLAAKIAHQTLGNSHLEAALAGISDLLKRGERFSSALEQALPSEVYTYQIVRLGEETGRLAETLIEVANRLDEWAETHTRRALQLVEPLIIMTLGALVALIIMAVLLGILSVNQLV